MGKTLMEQEAREAPRRVAEQISANAKKVAELGAHIRKMKPSVVMMVGRGSSDHAGVYAKYLIEIETGVPVVSAALSVASVYGSKLQLENALVIVVSQSGRSPDILAQAKMAKEGGAFCIALVNDEQSPIADIVDAVLPLKAGTEKAVAATKSYLATLSAILQLVAAWTKKKSLLTAIETLPAVLQTAVDSPRQLRAKSFQEINHCVVLGRGLGYAIAREIALKLKEVCGIHAEAFSSAEFLHGPVTLVERELTILDVLINDESVASHKLQIDNVTKRGATMIHLTQTADIIHPRLAPLALLQRFYIDIADIAISRGVNPDEPPGLKKVTQTL